MNSTTPDPLTTVAPGLTTSLVPLTPEEQATVAQLQAVELALEKYYLWVVFVLGFPGNVACVVTVLSMTTLSTATLYVALLAVADAVTLVAKLIFNQLWAHRAYMGDGGCKVTNIAAVFNCYASWMLVLVCFERFLAVHWPLKKAVFFTKTRAWLIAGVLFLVIVLIYIWLFVFYKSGKKGVFCGFPRSVQPFVQAWFWITSILLLFAPFCLLVVFTTLIVIGLRKYRAARKSILGQDTKHKAGGGKGDKRGGGADNSNMERAISIMMSVAAVVFLVLVLPNCIYVVFFSHWDEESYPRVTLARWKLFEQIAYVLVDLNHAVNFYLYFLTADKFRSHFKELVTCRGAKRGRKRSDFSTTGDHTLYTRASSTENLPMSRVL